MGTLELWKQQVRQLKTELYALSLAYKDPRVPWYARAVAACTVAYAFSPIDLIPDPIPILGYLDDLFIVPAGIALAIKLIPSDVLDECRANAYEVAKQGKPINWVAAAVIVTIWILLAAFAIVLVRRMMNV